jgi:hypothetical protein
MNAFQRERYIFGACREKRNGDSATPPPECEQRLYGAAAAAIVSICSWIFLQYLALSTRTTQSSSNEDGGSCDKEEKDGPFPPSPPLPLTTSSEEGRGSIQQNDVTKKTMHFAWEGVVETDTISRSSYNNNINNQPLSRPHEPNGNNKTFPKMTTTGSCSITTHGQQQQQQQPKEGLSTSSLLCQPINDSFSCLPLSHEENINEEKEEQTIDFLASMTFANGISLRAPSCPCCQ